MTYSELVQARHRNVPLIWNDPDPIEGNNYSIKILTDLNEESDHCLIQYGTGKLLSEATVPLNEISIDVDLLEDIAGFVYNRVNIMEKPLTESHVDDLTKIIRLSLLNSQGKLPMKEFLNEILY